ncbi:MAG: toll/interleukin-1 receptor domain-containing protein [Oscillospiraceae bacterium]|nr:toll/interleukin-1 receptor domain-containing protein [Oscillospiraceae bacterium]MBR6646310.1 toll/interleukin-1 receptor domain-containing protein [Clostridia bacterium]
MKVFISWSGELSKKIAAELKKWLPCIIQSVEVFYSPEDIEKGENWDSKISTELSECKYGIVCLTSENTNAPWINFEAGAIAKTLDSRVSALMVNIKPSEIQGPLKRYQATKLEKSDIFQLITAINSSTEPPLSPDVLDSTFNAIWDKMNESINSIISSYVPENNDENNGDFNASSEAIEEILQLLRKQNVLLSSPEQLFPEEYLAYINRKYSRNYDDELFGEKFVIYVNDLIESIYEIIRICADNNLQIPMNNYHQILSFIDYMLHIAPSKEVRHPKLRRIYMNAKERLSDCFNLVEKMKSLQMSLTTER